MTVPTLLKLLPCPGLAYGKAVPFEGDERERKIAAKIDTLWREVQWDWHTRGGENVLYWHWSPNHQWAMNHRIRGYDECLITYILAASSPTYPISPEVYHEGWARGGDIRTSVTQYGHTLTLRHNGAEQYGGPLFWAHYSYLGLDPRNLEDKYGNYWENNVSHTLINRAWCVENPHGYEGYGENSWGLTASYSTVGYSAHAPHNDLGVISPYGGPFIDTLHSRIFNAGNEVFLRGAGRQAVSANMASMMPSARRRTGSPKGILQ
jgi:hypothetical protein